MVNPHLYKCSSFALNAFLNYFTTIQGTVKLECVHKWKKITLSSCNLSAYFRLMIYSAFQVLVKLIAIIIGLQNHDNNVWQKWLLDWLMRNWSLRVECSLITYSRNFISVYIISSKQGPLSAERNLYQHTYGKIDQ